MARLKRILLAEDNARDVELVVEALEENHLANEIVVVRDGVKAMEYLRGQGEFANRSPESPVVVLLDLKMPRMDGLEVLRHMKEDEALRMIPVVMLTSSREERDLIESYRLGVNAYVVKPVVFDRFLEAVRTLGLFWAVVNETPLTDTRKPA